MGSIKPMSEMQHQLVLKAVTPGVGHFLLPASARPQGAGMWVRGQGTWLGIMSLYLKTLVRCVAQVTGSGSCWHPCLSSHLWVRSSWRGDTLEGRRVSLPLSSQSSRCIAGKLCPGGAGRTRPGSLAATTICCEGRDLRVLPIPSLGANSGSPGGDQDREGAS